jgi:hypothetical protein
VMRAGAGTAMGAPLSGIHRQRGSVGAARVAR